MGFFAWIEAGVRRAVLRGIESAAAEINEGGVTADVRLRLPEHIEPLRLPEEAREARNGRRKATV